MNTHVLIVGGGPAGIVSAITAKKNYPTKEVTLIRDKERVLVPCGIPYIFNRLENVEKNTMSDDYIQKNNINLTIGKVQKLNVSDKNVLLENGDVISYEKLIIATGSKPLVSNIKGADKNGVWIIEKDLDYLKKLRESVINNSKNIVIIGGGFIGVEIAEELSNIAGLDITIVERLGSCLATSFDRNFCEMAEQVLKNKGVAIKTNSSVGEIIGETKVEYVVLSSGERIPADLVILSIGARPNIELVKDSEIKTGSFGGIWVDEYMKTNVPDVFAVGDCAETRDFFTGDHVPIMLASKASMEARIAGANLYQLKLIRENKGSLNTFSTYLDGFVFGVAGLTEDKASTLGFEVVIGESVCPNHHPGTLPETHSVTSKLIFMKSSGTLLGAQVMGPENVSELINIAGLAIQNKFTAFDLEFLQVATHPLVTSAPTVYPLIDASIKAISQM
ncbi:FAD-dependent oxidoreductase [Patescibacteria group bacterium]|nr:FAD-dependent oxidoreductase [Patescibacteria group bacterium]